MTAKDAKSRFGQLLDMAIQAPVIVTKSGRPAVVVMSMGEYQRFVESDDRWWAAEAKKAAKDGYLSAAETKKFINSVLLNAANS